MCMIQITLILAKQWHIRLIRLSQLIRFARVSSHVDDFSTRNKVLTAKLLRQGYRYHNFVRRSQNFIGGILA